MRLALVTLALLVPAAAVRAQDARLDTTEGEPRIVVTATRSGKLTPDRSTVYLLIEGIGGTPSDAVQRANVKVQAVTGAVRPLGATEGLAVLLFGVAAAPFVNGFPNAPDLPSFVARFALRVQSTRLDQLTQMLAAALAAGAGSSSAPQFVASGVDSAHRVRVSEALTTAKEDAEALARSLGGRLGALIEVSTNSTPPQFFATPYISFSNRYTGGQSAAPEIVVTASVTVRYHFVPK